MRPVTTRKLRFLAGFAFYFGALWLLWESPVIYPLKIFVVLLHEWSHAVALLATGGSVERITLDRFQGGATYGRGGSAFLVLNAGYLGSLAWGALLVTVSRARWIRADRVNAVTAAAVIALTLAYVRNPFGIVFGVLFGTALGLTSRYLSRLWNRRAVLVLGLTSCLYAILDIKSDILDRPEQRSDARMLAELTGVPTLVWGAAWIAIALAASSLLLQRAFREA